MKKFREMFDRTFISAMNHFGHAMEAKESLIVRIIDRFDRKSGH